MTEDLGPTVLRDDAQQVDGDPTAPPSWDAPFQPPYWPHHPVEAGQVWRVKAPFYIQEVSGFEGFVEKRCIPGRLRDEDGFGHHDAEGWEVREVISLHRPGRFPTRVFYQRWWVLNGRRFGRKTCRVATLSMFRQWMNNHRGPFRWMARAELVSDGTGTSPPQTAEDATGAQATEGMNQ